MCSYKDFSGWVSQANKGEEKVSYDDFYAIIVPKNKDFAELLAIRQNDLEK